MKVTMIESPNKEDWMKVKQRALVTMGLSTVKTEPDIEWKHLILRAKHSPIRKLNFSFYIQDMPYWLSTEICRHHIGIEKYVKSQRNDRQQNYDRNAARQDAPVNMIIDINAESLMTVCEKRLCGVATKEAQTLLSEIKDIVIAKYPEFDGLLDSFCKKYKVCNEMKCCGRIKQY